MRYIIIDEANLIAHFQKQLKEEAGKDSFSFNVAKEQSGLAEFAEKIKAETREDDVILICLDIPFNGSRRVEQKGIELLKWLRLKNCNNHCIVYSDESLLKILKINPLNSILHSKGVTFIRLMFSPLDILQIDTSTKAEKANLLPFFRAEVDLVRIRHELANIWGAERLKWAVNNKYKEDKSNYKINLLTFISNNEKKSDHQGLRKKLDNLIQSFQKSNPLIYYYDDMAETWGPILKFILGNNFVCYTPKEKSEKDLIEELSNQRPKCLLLDLRLNNEKEHSLDPIKLSGGKLLEEIKKRYFTLPIIMFTATNKAESVRRLLASGAEYVWTKEGIDDGINDELTLQNTIDLLQKIKNACLKFRNKVYENIYELETKIGKTYVANKQTQNIIENGELKDFHTIIFDTNYLIDGVENVGPLLHLHKLLLVNKVKSDKPNKRIIIHDDVFYELFRISKLWETKNEDKDDFRVPACRYLIKLLFDWKKAGLLWDDNEYGQQNIITKISNTDISETLTPIENIDFEINTFFEKITLLYNNRLRTSIQEINEKIEQINIGLKSIPDLKKLRLHFDDTLKEIVPKYIAQGNVLLVTNDNTCAYNVGQLFEQQKNVKYTDYNCKFSLYNKQAIKNIKGIKSATKNEKAYQHLTNVEFTKLFV